VKIKLHDLRRIIREEVGTMVFVHNAGFGGMGGVSRLTRHKEIPPPFLGDEEGIDQEGEYEEEEKWSQWTVSPRNRISK
jgi:hypothetical protein